MATLTVKKVGPIREAQLDVKKHTIFIGPQGSGKSTLAKLIAICSDSELFKYESERDLWSKYSFDDWFTQKTEFSFYDTHYTVVFKNGLNVSPENPKKKIFQSIKENWLSNKRIVEEKEKNASEDTNLFWERLENSELRLSNFIKELIPFSSIYIPFERMLISILTENIWTINSLHINLPPLMTYFGRRFEIARHNIKQLSIDFLSVAYKNSRLVVMVIMS